MSGVSDEARQGKPPIRQVRYTVFFKCPEAMRASGLGALYDSWRERYPLVEEEPPLPPIDATDDEESDGPWPLPLTTFEARTNSEVLLLQADRLALIWGARSAAEGYPGFESIRRELVERYDELAARADALSWGPLEITRVECRYVNELEVPLLHYIAGRLTNWGAEPANQYVVTPDESAELTVHGHMGPGAKTPTWITARSGARYSTTELLLTVQLDDVTASDSVSHLFAKVHTIATTIFLASTSPTMRMIRGLE